MTFSFPLLGEVGSGTELSDNDRVGVGVSSICAVCVSGLLTFAFGFSATGRTSASVLATDSLNL